MWHQTVWLWQDVAVEIINIYCNALKVQLEGLALPLCTAMLVCGCTLCSLAVLVLRSGVCTVDISDFPGLTD